MSAPSVDGRRFELVTSTASAVDQRRRTWFDYHERSGVVWGEYGGGIAVEGRFVGTRFEDRLQLQFVHVLQSSTRPVVGTASSAIEVADDGRLRLIEDFDVDDVPHRSISIEVRDDD